MAASEGNLFTGCAGIKVAVSVVAQSPHRSLTRKPAGSGAVCQVGGSVVAGGLGGHHGHGHAPVGAVSGRLTRTPAFLFSGSCLWPAD